MCVCVCVFVCLCVCVCACVCLCSLLNQSWAGLRVYACCDSSHLVAVLALQPHGPLVSSVYGLCLQMCVRARSCVLGWVGGYSGAKR